MHTDLSKHLHTDKCNELIGLLYECRATHPLTKLFGACNIADYRMTDCLKQERIERRRKNFQQSVEKKAKLQELFRLDREERRKAKNLPQ